MARHQNQLAPVVGERVVQREAGPLHARQPIESTLELAIQRGQLRLRVTRGRTVQRHDDAALHLVPELLMFELVQTPREHRRAGHEHDRQRRLHDQQRLPRERRVIAGAAARSAQRVHRIGPCGEPRRRRTEGDAGQQRQPERKRENNQRRRGADREEVCVRECQREEQSGGAHRDEQSGDAARDREQHALDERLRHDLPPRRADGETHRGLRAARHRAREQEVRDIRARDEQDEPAHSEQDLQAASVLFFHHADGPPSTQQSSPSPMRYKRDGSATGSDRSITA